MSTRKLIIDTDPGIDDAVCIFLALASPELELVGLTSVFGNMGIDVTTRNALALLEVAGRTDVPVARGAAGPLMGRFRGGVPYIHGPEGMGNATLPDPTTTVVPVPAAEFLHQTASAHPGEVTVVAVGPLTNLALATRLHPDLPELVAEVVIMGGNAYERGNASTAAEANILSDPEAADIVFAEDWPLTMVGLDVTNPVILTGAQIDALGATGTPVNRVLADALGFYRDFHASLRDRHDGICPHDATALSVLLAPERFETEPLAVRVELSGPGRGKTWPDTDTEFHDHAPWEGRPPVTICTGVDASAISGLVAGRLGSPPTRS